MAGRINRPDIRPPQPNRPGGVDGPAPNRPDGVNINRPVPNHPDGFVPPNQPGVPGVPAVPVAPAPRPINPVHFNGAPTFEGIRIKPEKLTEKYRGVGAEKF